MTRNPMRRLIQLVAVTVAVVIGGVAYFVSNRPAHITEDLGVPVYPGAQAKAGDSFSARLSPRDREKIVRAVLFQTDDPPGLVISYYKEALGQNSRVFETKKGGLPSAVFQTELEGIPRIIIVSMDEVSEKTEILIGMQK